MNLRIRFLPLSLLVLLTAAAMPLHVTARDRAIRILAIGNSFSQDAIEQNLFELAAAEGIPVIIGNAYIGGCSLERHVGNARGNKAAYAYRKIGLDGRKVETRGMSLERILSDEAWDYVSFQQASPLSGRYESYEAWLPELVAYVRARVPKKVRLVLHQTWAYAADSGHTGFRNYDRDQLKMYRAINDAVRKAARLVGIRRIVPSGTAVQNARTSFIGDRMTRDGYHLDLVHGRYTAACAWFETLFRKNVVGNPYAPKGMTPDWKEATQRAAHEAVRHPFVVTPIDVRPLPAAEPPVRISRTGAAETEPAAA